MADKRTLTVSMRAEVAHLRKGINESVGLMKSLQKSSTATANVLKTAFAAGATMFAFNQIQNGIRNTIAAFSETATMIEDTKHLADALGTTTGEIQVLQRAAALAEVDVDMLSRNVKVLTKNLGQASMGNGAAVDMLNQIGLDAKELIKLPLTEQLAAIGDRMQTMGSAAQRVAVATALFGRAGTDMIPFLMQSADGLREIQSEMIATGEVFSDTDAAMVDEMGDSVTMAYGVWNAFKNQLVIQIAPAIKYLADLTREWASTSNGAIRNIVSDGLAYLVDGVADVIDSVNKMRAVWYGLKAGVLLIATSLTWAWKAFGSGFNLVMTGVQETFFRILKAIGAGIDNLTAGVANLAGLVPGMGNMQGTNFAGSMQGFVDDAKKARQQAWEDFGAGNDPFVQSLAKDSADALQKGSELWASKSDLGDKFRSKAMEVLGTPIDTEMKTYYDDTMDILPELEKEKAIRDDINNTMKDTADLAKEIKDYGEGTSYRTGEYSPRVGGVSGGVMGGAMADGIGMSASAVAATTQGNTRTGADQNTTLLQGILEATRMTATNTMRSPVAVLG